MIILHNDRLEVQIQEPGSGYRRCRFDWCGICQQITLDGTHSRSTFCSQEASDAGPGTEGVGLSDEFGINTPIGYDEAEVGDWFPKIGVGYLQRTSPQAYSFMDDYPIEPIKNQVEQKSEKEVIFLQCSEKYNGWGWKLLKTLLLTGPMLTITYSLENTGEKAIQTETYNHNFMAINANTIGPNYELQVPFSFNLDQSMGPIVTNENTLTLTKTPQNYVYALQENCYPRQAVEWQLIHRPSGQGVRVTEPSPLFKFAIWGMSHVISPEFFLLLDLKPGQTQTWQRLYAFF